MTVLTFDVQYKPQLSITKNYQEAYMCEDLAPMVDKGVDSTWQKMVDSDRVSLSKGTSPTFIVAYILFFFFFKYLLALIYVMNGAEVTADI